MVCDIVLVIRTHDFIIWLIGVNEQCAAVERRVEAGANVEELSCVLDLRCEGAGIGSKDVGCRRFCEGADTAERQRGAIVGCVAGHGSPRCLRIDRDRARNIFRPDLVDIACPVVLEEGGVKDNPLGRRKGSQV